MEQIHQVINNLVHKFDLKNNYLDEDDPWVGILSSTDFVVKIAYCTLLQAISVQLVFGWDMIVNTPFIDELEAINIFKQGIIDKNNQN